MEINALKNESRALLLSAYCKQNQLLTLQDGVLRLPFLIRGSLRAPPLISRSAIEKGFAELDQKKGISQAAATYLRLENAQVLREAVIDRELLTPTGEYLYTVMPIFQSYEVIEQDHDELARDLFEVPFSEILAFTESLRQTLEAETEFVDQVRAITQKTAELPNFWHDAGFSAFSVLLDSQTVSQMVDADLSAWQIPGRRFLDGWQSIEQAVVQQEPIQILMNLLHPELENSLGHGKVQMRALPTRQLHITAGNSPQIPLISLLRALITKSPAVIKLPFGATAPGALVAMAAALVRPDHPLTKHLSVVYWRGGDDKVESSFFRPEAFDRIVVWGAPDAVASVKNRALFTKILTFNPRYGVSFIGPEAFANDQTLHQVALRGVADSLVANQKACIASQIHYVQGTPEQINKYALKLQAILATMDEAAPNYVKPSVRGEIKRLQRGSFLDADGYINQSQGHFSSGVVVIHDEFNVSQHPMSRMIVVRPLSDLKQALNYLHHGVSTVSVYPSKTMHELRDAIAARGVSQVMELGRSGTGFAGQSHDGMMVLSELVDWKNSVESKS